ncbi:hypothetical protein HOP51_16840 [Halomonas sp. MCCC 1A11036]|uniref:Uncharacterized protein n=1 Tax=Billgrantia zhangzhouensis TaxID=2733481 RepID=A0ABS9AJ67_9GAMM|nr:hypothetical protein [Halomonas zhangzhouensis]MCE8021766.1 hypothetical protein [Halomonas zhangzhouensis]
MQLNACDGVILLGDATTHGARVISAQVDADDSYVLTWRDNGPIGWWELYWPLICTVIGVGGFVGVIGWIVSGLWR